MLDRTTKAWKLSGRLVFALMVCVGLANAQSAVAQSAVRPLQKRPIPCSVQYAEAVRTIGLARWTAPEPARPRIERLLNAAAEAKELIDADFLGYVDPLCSAETLAQLRISVSRLDEKKWLPTNADGKRAAQAAAANAELLKAIQAAL